MIKWLCTHLLDLVSPGNMLVLRSETTRFRIVFTLSEVRDVFELVKFIRSSRMKSTFSGFVELVAKLVKCSRRPDTSCLVVDLVVSSWAKYFITKERVPWVSPRRYSTNISLLLLMNFFTPGYSLLVMVLMWVDTVLAPVGERQT